MMKYHVLFCFQKHSIRLAAAPTPRPVSVLVRGMKPALDAAGGWSPKPCRPALSSVHELLLRLRQPPRPQDAVSGHAEPVTLCCGSAQPTPWRAQSLGIDARQPQEPTPAWRNTSEALCRAGLERRRVLQQGPGNSGSTVWG